MPQDNSKPIPKNAQLGESPIPQGATLGEESTKKPSLLEELNRWWTTPTQTEIPGNVPGVTQEPEGMTNSPRQSFQRGSALALAPAVPALTAGLVTAPLTTGLGLAGGVGGSLLGGTGGRYVGEKVGAPELGEDIGSTFGGLAGGYGGGRLGAWRSAGANPTLFDATKRAVANKTASWIPARMPKTPQGSPFGTEASGSGWKGSQVTGRTGAAQEPFEPLVYESEAEANQRDFRMANLERQAKAAGMYSAAQGKTGRPLNYQQRIGRTLGIPSSSTSEYEPISMENLRSLAVTPTPEGITAPSPLSVAGEGLPQGTPTPFSAGEGTPQGRGLSEDWMEAARRGAPGESPVVKSVRRHYNKEAKK